MILITIPFLPPIEQFKKYVDEIWERKWLTNNGPLVKQLESDLKDYLGVNYLAYVSNGTIALQIAINALDLSGEIITTPFSYVATTSSIIWEGCKAVFVDIDPESLNINPVLIEQAISPNTSAILATHVYGNPCDVNSINKIAKKHNLKVIYDGAHAFGVKLNGKSIFSHGDITTSSMHATKLYHSIEGGLVVSKYEDIHKKVSFMRNFGHDGPENYAEIGINGKNSEFHAAMGLCNLKYVDEIICKRQELSTYYDNCLNEFKATKPKLHNQTEYNFAYYPIIIDSIDLKSRVFNYLRENQIYARRYFYPSLDTLSYVNEADVPVCRDISERILCLPLHPNLKKTEIDLICDCMMKIQKK